MTKRLYLDNCYLFEFESRVTAVRQTAEGAAISLEETGFYPETGGQLFDVGDLGGSEIFRVSEEDSGEIWHFTKLWNHPVGASVKGIINQTRRFDNMRKHTGQHILSRAFIETSLAETVSSRLGDTESTIELSMPDLDDASIRRAEELANDIVMRNLPINISYYSREQLQTIPVRKIPERDGVYRLIQIGEFDYSACGGTHCRQTGEVGLIKIIGREKLRGHLRVNFLTGRQAFSDYYDKDRALSQLTSKMTCHFNDLGRSLEKLMGQCQNYRRETALLSGRILQHELRQAAEIAPQIEGVHLISAEFDDYDVRALKETSAKVAENYRSILLILSGDKLLITVSRDLSPGASELAKIVLAGGDGKGGGNAQSAQVGGLLPEKRFEIRRRLITYIEERLGRD